MSHEWDNYSILFEWDNYSKLFEDYGRLTGTGIKVAIKTIIQRTPINFLPRDKGIIG